MTCFVQFLEPFPRDMGVDLGGGDVGMPQHHLNGTQIRTGFQKMAGE